MSDQMKITLIAFSGLLLLSACQHGVEFPVRVEAPTNATDMHVSESPDKTSYELSFVVAGERDNYSAADQMESQLTKAGYARCGSGKGQWETLKHRRGDKTVDEIRLLRFFKTGDAGQLGTIFARQHCKEGKNECEQEFLVRQINVPESHPDRDKLREICK